MLGQKAMEKDRTKGKTCWALLTIAVVPLLMMSAVTAQNLLSGDPSHSYSAETLFINPAVAPFHPHRVMVGMKVHQLGFLKSNEFGLRSSYISYSVPEELLGWMSMAVTGQNFTTLLYGQTNLSVLLAKQPMRRISFGLKYNLFTKSYHQKHFDMIDPGDPVFAAGTTKLAHSIGLGVILFPWKTISIGFSCDHLNRPDVSLSADVYRQPMVYDWGIGYSWRWFTSSIAFNYMQGHWQTNWSLEGRPFAFSALQFGLVQQAARFGARIEVSPRLTFDYAFDYPLYEINRASSGSHQISIVYQLSRDEELVKLTRSAYDEGHFPRFDFEPQFFVAIESDKLEILAHQIQHTIAEDVAASALRNLNAVELALDDSLVEVSKLYYHGDAADQRVPALATVPRYSQKYESWLADNLLKKKIGLLRLVPEESAVERAKNLYNFMINNAPFLADHVQIQPILRVAPNPTSDRDMPRPRSRQVYQLTPESVRFNISSIKMRKYHRPWRLEIRDGNHKIVKTFVGETPVPKSIDWDWRDDHGHLIGPDVYRYAIYWQDEHGRWHQSDEKTFYVQKISRRLEIDVRSQPKPDMEPGEIVEIKFVN